MTIQRRPVATFCSNWLGSSEPSHTSNIFSFCLTMFNVSLYFQFAFGSTPAPNLLLVTLLMGAYMHITINCQLQDCRSSSIITAWPCGLSAASSQDELLVSLFSSCGKLALNHVSNSGQSRVDYGCSDVTLYSSLSAVSWVAARW